MKTIDFLNALRNAPDKELLFVNESGELVHRGYHLTEIKAASYQTVDCGGQSNDWHETILQLWVPEDADDDYMKADKFIRIFDSVRSKVPLNEDADLRIEYGDENFFPSVYNVASMSSDRQSVRILLQAPETTCKARDRQSSEADACCK